MASDCVPPQQCQGVGRRGVNDGDAADVRVPGRRGSFTAEGCVGLTCCVCVGGMGVADLYRVF